MALATAGKRLGDWFSVYNSCTVILTCMLTPVNLHFSNFSLKTPVCTSLLTCYFYKILFIYAVPKNLAGVGKGDTSHGPL